MTIGELKEHMRATDSDELTKEEILAAVLNLYEQQKRGYAFTFRFAVLDLERGEWHDAADVDRDRADSESKGGR